MGSSLAANEIQGNCYQLSEDDLKIQTPARIILSGPSSSGKSFMIRRLAENIDKIFNTKFETVIYVYPESMYEVQKDYIAKLGEFIPNLIAIEGLDNVNFDVLTQDNTPKLLILEDLMMEIGNHKLGASLCSRWSHHFSITYIITVQNYFWNSKFSQELRRNTTELFLYRDRADLTVLSVIARKKFKSCPNLLLDAMEWMENQRISRPDQYLLIESNPLSKLPKEFGVRTNILPNEKGDIEPIVFTCKK